MSTHGHPHHCALAGCRHYHKVKTPAMLGISRAVEWCDRHVPIMSPCDHLEPERAAQQDDRTDGAFCARPPRRSLA
jgi:hypothetical protein